MNALLAHAGELTYNYNTTNTTTYSTPPTFMYGSWVFGLLSVIGMWKTFQKAGKPGWAAIIPIYNTIVMLQIIGENPWLVLLLLVPIVNIVFAIIWAVRLGKCFGKSGVWSFFLLILLSPIGYMLLGFGKATYQGPLKGTTPVSPTSTTPPAPAAPTAPTPPAAPATPAS